jgi:cellulose synthase/poly-beta-1,6-N-acetylglucosamine synthase-like glycosyltransferase
VISILEIALVCVGALLMLPALVLLAEVLAAITYSVGQTLKVTPFNQQRLRVAVIVPAHNEAANIQDTLNSIIPQLRNSDRLIVVADNCSDDTASIALRLRAEVVVRTDLANRGKGYALDFGIRHLREEAPEIVIILDADCRIASNSLEILAQLCARAARPIQAVYLMRAANTAGFKTRIAEFACVVKNCVRPIGLHRMGLPCQLMGTGMAFPWSSISNANLASGHIVEDLKLGIDLARAGTPPLFCPEALVTSDFPDSKEGVQSQRTRWEHGHLGVILQEGPRLLLESILKRDLNLMALAIDLSVPPVALLMLQVTFLWVVCAIMYALEGILIPLIISTATSAFLFAAVLLSWGRFGREIVSLGGLLYSAVYAIWKIPLYAKFIVARQMDWVRSKRSGED